LKIPKKTGSFVIYSASNFWPDVIPAVVLKKKNPDLKWIGSCYLLAPNSFKGFEQKWRLLPNIRLLASNFMESVTNVFLRKYADVIFVTNDLDKKFFADKGVSSVKLKAIYGGVDLTEILKVPEQRTKYDCCFVGRIHPQKGVVYLIDIWDKVHNVKPDAKLALIGNGPKWYENKVKAEIRKRHLEKNIDLLGFVDGTEKYRILKSSKIFLHTSIYDNCGMTAAEGMACGLPAIRFDIPALKIAYPRGMLVVPLRDCKKFAEAVLKLLDDDDLYNKLKHEALELVKSWNWDEKASCLLDYVRRELI
jgi:glycosyltransferase involved in cell wall biosynthesis